MPLYKFKVSDSAGRVSEFLIEGDSQGDATRRLQRRGVIPLEFLGEGGSTSSSSARGWSMRRRFDIIDFTDRLVPLLEADIPLERALGILSEGLRDEFANRVVADMRRGLHEGRKFSQLVHDRAGLFPPLYASVIEAGEEAGALPQVMGELRRFLNDSRELQSFIITASIYPFVVLTMSLGMVAVLLGFIVPRFAAVLQVADRQLPASTRFLLGVSDLLRGYWWVLPILAAVAAVLIHSVRADGRFRPMYDDLILRVPVIRRVVLLSNLARMSRTMAILMRSGVHLLDTVSVAARVLQNRTLRQSIAGLGGELRQGQRLSNALGHSRFIPPFMLRMLAVGEETGTVEPMLERVAERYESDLRRLIRRVISLFEPIIIVCLGLIVALIVVSMFLAILDIQSGL